jgi:hypothetical protein
MTVPVATTTVPVAVIGCSVAVARHPLIKAQLGRLAKLRPARRPRRVKAAQNVEQRRVDCTPPKPKYTRPCLTGTFASA